MTASYVIQILKVMAVTYLMGNWSAGFEWVKRIRRPKYKDDFPVSFVRQLNRETWTLGSPLKTDLKRPLNVLSYDFSYSNLKILLGREDPSNPEKVSCVNPTWSRSSASHKSRWWRRYQCEAQKDVERRRWKISTSTTTLRRKRQFYDVIKSAKKLQSRQASAKNR